MLVPNRPQGRPVRQEMSSRFVLLNLAHQGRRPRCARAAFRILGVFGSVDEAKEHAALLPTDVSLHMLPLSTWTPIMRDEDESGAITHLEALGQRNRDRIQEHAEEFESNVSNCRAGVVREVVESPKVVLEDATGCVAKVPLSGEVRMQRFAVISVLQDEAEEGDQQQPAILVWDVSDTEQDARDVIKDRIGRSISDVHLDVVTMYEWLFPTCVDLSQVKEEYRDEKLDQVMRHRKEEHTRVAEFKHLCEQRGQEVPVIDLNHPREGELILPPIEPPCLESLPMQS